MGLKSYIISTILLIIVLFGFVHSLELGDILLVYLVLVKLYLFLFGLFYL